MKYPKVFIIILNYNGGDIFEKCLESVYRLNYSNFEVVVVDNKSTQGVFKKMKVKYPKFHFIENNHNVGFAAGNNVAIRWALEKMADYVFLLNNDALVEKNALSVLIEEGEKHKKAGILSPIIYKNSSDKIWFSGGRINWLKMRAEHQKDILKTEYITGCAMLIKKDVFKRVGLLDEDFFLYYEDVDFSFRSKKEGFKLKIVKNAKVYHFEKSAENLNKIYYLVLSGIIFFRKNSNFIFRIYIELYLFLRKIKNFIDLYKNKNNKKAKLVQEAYRNI